MRSMVLCCLLAAGCVTSPVVPLDDGNYVSSVHTFFGATTRSQLVDKATSEAQDYCAQQGKVAHVKNAVGTGYVGLTNLSSNVVFSCETPINTPPPQAQR